jgi:hypothetical protein
MSTSTYWEMLDTEHPEYVSELVSLINISTNYDAPTPIAVFLDLIGYSEEYYGEPIVLSQVKRMDYLSLSYLADAVQEYVKRPLDVIEWYNKLQDTGE